MNIVKKHFVLCLPRYVSDGGEISVLRYELYWNRFSCSIFLEDVLQRENSVVRTWTSF